MRYTPPRKGAKVEDDNVLTPMDHLPKAAHIKGLIQCTGLWFAGGKWGVTWKLVQAMVQKPVRLVGSGQCQIADDSDDEEMSEALNKRSEKKEDTQKVEDSEEEEDNNGPTFPTDDDEDEEEEEKPETPPPAPKKKKKVVRRKKVKTTA